MNSFKRDIYKIAFNQKPLIAADDFLTLNKGQTKNTNVINNDTNPYGRNLSVIIVSQPTYGTLNILPNNTIDYTHNNTNNFSDSFTYKLNDGFRDSNVATVNIAVGVQPGDSITASGGTGVFLVPFVVGTDPGDLVIHFNAIGVPDRLEILFDINNNPDSYVDASTMPTVADTLFVGDDVVNNQSVPLNGTTSSLDLNLYNTNTLGFDVVESGTQSITITDVVVASNAGNRTDADPNGPSRGAINGSLGTQKNVQNLVYNAQNNTETGNNYADGNIALRYEKPASTAFIAYLKVSGTSATRWDILKTEFFPK